MRISLFAVAASMLYASSSMAMDTEDTEELASKPSATTIASGLAQMAIGEGLPVATKAANTTTTAIAKTSEIIETTKQDVKDIAAEVKPAVQQAKEELKPAVQQAKEELKPAVQQVQQKAKEEVKKLP